MLNKITTFLFKNNVIRMIAALTVVGMISGYMLVFVYSYAMPKIEDNINKEIRKSINSIFPGVKKIEQEKDIYKAIDRKNKLLGYAFIAEGSGYQGTIKLIVGIGPNAKKMKGMEVLESQETPGLGAEIANPNFKKQFIGLSIKEDIECVKNLKPEKSNQIEATTGATISSRKSNQIEAITGATISSRAVVNILNKKIKEIKKTIDDRP